MKRNNKGSAMMVAIVASLVVMMYCLSLLLISYSLFFSVSEESAQYQCREIVKSLSNELEGEITLKFADYAEECDAKYSHPLWYFIRSNVLQSSWPYYNPDEWDHPKEVAFRNFDLTSSGGGSSITEGVTVCMYWESSLDVMRERETAGDEAESEIPLYVTVKCVRGNHTYEVTSTYYLKIAQWEDIADNMNTAVDESERWEWYLGERE